MERLVREKAAALVAAAEEFERAAQSLPEGKAKTILTFEGRNLRNRCGLAKAEADRLVDHFVHLTL